MNRKKSERLLEAIGNLNDQTVQEAAKRPERRKRWPAAVAAVLAAAVISGAVLLPGGPAGGSASAAQVTRAVYPEQAAYPDESKYFNPLTGQYDAAWDDAYDAWREQRREARNNRPEEAYLSQLAAFTDLLLPAVLEGTENRVCSPMNLYMALAMLSEITDGNSRQQVLDLLGVADLDTLRQQTAKVWLSTYVDDGATAAILGNSVWLNETIPFRKELLNTLAESYYASSFSGEMGSQALNQALRDWINQQTGGLLSQLTEGLELEDNTVVALVSTLYFSAKWSSEFDEAKTGQGSFTLADGTELICDFMHKRMLNADYYDGDGFSAVPLSFENSDSSMLLILPDEGTELEELLEDPAVLSLIRGAPEESVEQERLIVNLSMPKFDVASDLELSDTLQELGVTEAFDPVMSDFTPLTEDADGLALSMVRHGARVTVDEEGCRAAAYTLMMVSDSAPMPEEREVDFVLDRPFLFVITGLDHLPLFVGTVYVPS